MILVFIPLKPERLPNLTLFSKCSVGLNTFLSKLWNVLSFIIPVNISVGRCFFVRGSFEHLDTKYCFWWLWAPSQISFSLQSLWITVNCALLLLIQLHHQACSQCLSELYNGNLNSICSVQYFLVNLVSTNLCFRGWPFPLWRDPELFSYFQLF